MDIVCDNHKSHDLKWVVEEQCIACIIELLDNSEFSKSRKKVILMCFMKLMRSTYKNEIAVLLSDSEGVVSHSIRLLIEVISSENQELSLNSLVEETLIELVNILADEKIQEIVIAGVARKLDEVGLKHNSFSSLCNLLGHLLLKYPRVLSSLLDCHCETVDLLTQGLTYLDEEVRMSCSFVWFQMLVSNASSSSSSSSSLICISSLQKVVFDVLFVLEMCDLSQDVQLNMLGLLKMLIDTSPPVHEILLKVAEHSDGVQVMQVFKKLVRDRNIKVQVGAAQCLLVLLRGTYCQGHSELSFRTDLTEYLFEALNCTSEILISSLLRCLELQSLQEKFYKRHFDIYGIESLVRCMESCCARHLISPLSHAFRLLINMLTRHEVGGVKLFTDNIAYLHLMDVIDQSVEMSQQFQRECKSFIDQAIKTFHQLIRVDYLPLAVPLKKISQVASALIQQVTKLQESSSLTTPAPTSSTSLPDDDRHRLIHHHHHALKKRIKDVADDDDDEHYAVHVSTLIVHKWRLLLEILTSSLLDDDAFRCDFQENETNRDERIDSEIFGCRDYFDHLCRSYFERSVSLIMSSFDKSNTKSMNSIDLVTSNHLASISTSYDVYYKLIDKYHSSFVPSFNPRSFSRSILDVGDGGFMTTILEYKGRSCASEDTKLLVNKVTMEILKPILMELMITIKDGEVTGSGGDDNDLEHGTNNDIEEFLVLISEGLQLLEGTLKEIIDDFIETSSSMAVGDDNDDWESRAHDGFQSRDPRSNHRIASHGAALCCLLFVDASNDAKYFIPRRIELIVSVVYMLCPSSLTTGWMMSVMMLKFIVYLLSLDGTLKDVENSGIVNIIDEQVNNKLSEWMEIEFSSINVWCPMPIKFLNWSYRHQCFHRFCEHFMLPHVLKTSGGMGEIIMMATQHEICLKSIMSIFASSNDKQILVNILDLLRASFLSRSHRSSCESQRSGLKNFKKQVKGLVLSVVPKVFVHLSDQISKYNKVLFLNLMTFLHDDDEDFNNDDDKNEHVDDDDDDDADDDIITTQDLKVVGYVENLLQTTNLFAMESVDVVLNSSSLLFINSMLIKSYRIRNQQVFLLLTSTSNGKLLRSINSINSFHPSTGEYDRCYYEDVYVMHLVALQTLCLLLAFHATFEQPFRCRLYINELNIDLTMRPPQRSTATSTPSASSDASLNGDNKMMVLSQSIRTLFWGLYFMCASNPTLRAIFKEGVDDHPGGYIRILYDESKRRDNETNYSKKQLTFTSDVPIYSLRHVYNVTLNLAANENEILRVCCINCMSVIIKYLETESHDNDAVEFRRKFKKHLLNHYWMDYLIKNILINISSSSSPFIPTSYLKLIDLMVHRNSDSMMTSNAMNDLMNINEIPKVVASWFCREEVVEGSNLLLTVIDKILEKNLLKSEKVLKERVHDKIKSFASDNSQENKYSVCGVLSRLHWKLRSLNYDILSSQQ